MNLFILSLNPKKCARYHCDKHVVKMILELAQMLWTAHHLGNGIENTDWQDDVPDGIKIYKATHKNHPMAIWVRNGTGNYNFTAQVGMALCKEYTYRYGKTHASQAGIEWLLANSPPVVEGKSDTATYASAIGRSDLTPIPLCMPEEYRDIFDNPVYAYRLYYVAEKSGFVTYKKGKRKIPSWYRKGLAAIEETEENMSSE